MVASPRVRVYMGCSFDGFIADPEHDIDWLSEDHRRPNDLAADPAGLQFDAFMSQVGAMLMGRTTYDVVAAMGHWPYGETPVLVATNRSLEPVANTVEAVAGTIEDLLSQTKVLAGDKDVYLDGGDLTRQAINAGLVDEITATFIPILLGEGARLFDGLVARTKLQFVAHHALDGGLLQITARPYKGLQRTPASRGG